MFRAIISPILKNTRLCLQLVVQYTGDAACLQYNPRNNSTNKSQAIEDGCINIRNMVSIK